MSNLERPGLAVLILGDFVHAGGAKPATPALDSAYYPILIVLMARQFGGGSDPLPSQRRSAGPGRHDRGVAGAAAAAVSPACCACRGRPDLVQPRRYRDLRNQCQRGAGGKWAW